VEVDGAGCTTAEVLADRLRHTKNLAKAQEGCACLLAAGSRVIDLLNRAEPSSSSAHAPARAEPCAAALS
jgi:hypothetical protein